MSEDEETMLKKYITRDDMCNLEWRILDYMCKMCDKYETFPETELLEKTGAKGYIDEMMQQDYLVGKPDSYYKLLMDMLMNSLIERNAVEAVKYYEYGGLGDDGILLFHYKKTTRLERNKKICVDIMKHGLRTREELGKLLI
jgi:hypothetical protein